MEAYNFSSDPSVITLHAEKEGGGASVASDKMMAKSVFSIATNITSDKEGKGATNNKESDNRSVIEIDGMEVVELEVQSLTNNMNYATENFNSVHKSCHQQRRVRWRTAKMRRMTLI
jgi:hypothetical protein